MHSECNPKVWSRVHTLKMCELCETDKINGFFEALFLYNFPVYMKSCANSNI